MRPAAISSRMKLIDTPIAWAASAMPIAIRSFS
jgi:hypothetical protein